jgi:hypothetical protein
MSDDKSMSLSILKFTWNGGPGQSLAFQKEVKKESKGLAMDIETRLVAGEELAFVPDVNATGGAWSSLRIVVGLLTSEGSRRIGQGIRPKLMLHPIDDVDAKGQLRVAAFSIGQPAYPPKHFKPVMSDPYVSSLCCGHTSLARPARKRLPFDQPVLLLPVTSPLRGPWASGFRRGLPP